MVYSGAATWAVLKLVALFVPLRAEARRESRGLDVAQHGEEAYSTGEGAILVLESGRREPRLPAVAPGAATVVGEPVGV